MQQLELFPDHPSRAAQITPEAECLKIIESALTVAEKLKVGWYLDRLKAQVKAHEKDSR